jgi:hypothetical protein
MSNTIMTLAGARSIIIFCLFQSSPADYKSCDRYSQCTQCNRYAKCDFCGRKFSLNIRFMAALILRTGIGTDILVGLT